VERKAASHERGLGFMAKDAVTERGFWFFMSRQIQCPPLLSLTCPHIPPCLPSSYGITYNRQILMGDWKQWHCWCLEASSYSDQPNRRKN